MNTPRSPQSVSTLEARSELLMSSETSTDVAMSEDADRFIEEARTVLRLSCQAIGWPTECSDPNDFETQQQFYRQLCARGWGALAWPREYGGAGRSLREQAGFIQLSVQMGVPHVFNRVALGIAGPAIMIFGSPEIKRRFLPGILAGEEVWCQGFSEPGAGSDLAGLTTRADQQPDGHYRITGQKVWTTLAAHADHCMLLARTSPDRYRGITAFLMPMRQAGVEVRPIKQIHGDSDFCEVFLDGARVDSDLVLGAEGQGWPIAMRALEAERSVHLVHRQVLLSSMIDSLILTASALPARTANLRALVDLKIDATAMQYAVQGLLRTLDEGGNADVRANMTKVWWSETYQRVARLAVDLAAAAEDEASLRMWLREYYASLSTSIYAGTNEIQRNIIAERGLGLPR
jgi:alkylation response protein AidB-like acyl-CoA dehydrogenase